MVSEAVEIADAGDDVARDKLRVDTRFRLAKYHDSKVYGDKVDVNHNVVPVFMVTIAAEGGHVIDVPSERVNDAVPVQESPL